MGDKSRIEWTDATWNPVVGCTKVSQGCKHCYAKMLHDMRHKAYSDGKKVPDQYAQPFEVVQLKPERLDMPLRWKRPRMIFVNSVSDLFHEDVPFWFIDKVFAVMGLAKQHTFQILTKRAERMVEYMCRNRYSEINDAAWEITGDHGFALLPTQKHGMVPGRWPFSNVWLGVSVENQKMADERIPLLLKVPAAVRFLSCEPLLGPLDLSAQGSYGFGQCLDCGGVGETAGDYFSVDNSQICERCGGSGLEDSAVVDWVIVGGESGPEARPMHPDWARSLRDQCRAAEVPFFFKQWGEWVPVDYLDKYWPPYFERITWPVPADWPKDEPFKRERSVKVGKKHAGAVLDDKEWRQMPND